MSEKKKLEISQKFEEKKTNFLNSLFVQVDTLRTDLNDLKARYDEVEAELKEKEEKLETKKKK